MKPSERIEQIAKQMRKTGIPATNDQVYLAAIITYLDETEKHA